MIINNIFIPSDEGKEIINKNVIDLNDAISRKDVIALFEDEQVKKEVPKFCELMIEIINLLPSVGVTVLVYSFHSWPSKYGFASSNIYKSDLEALNLLTIVSSESK